MTGPKRLHSRNEVVPLPPKLEPGATSTRSARVAAWADGSTPIVSPITSIDLARQASGTTAASRLSHQSERQSSVSAADLVVMRIASSTDRRSFCDTHNSQAQVMWCSLFPNPCKRLNVVDGALVKEEYLQELWADHLVGRVPLSELPTSLNGYEAACFARRWAPTHSRMTTLDAQPRVRLQQSAAVFLVPVAHHMRRRPPPPAEEGEHAHAHAHAQHRREKQHRWAHVRERISVHREHWVMVLLQEAPNARGAGASRQWLWPVKRESELESDTVGAFTTVAEWVAAANQAGASRAPTGPGQASQGKGKARVGSGTQAHPPTSRASPERKHNAA